MAHETTQIRIYEILHRRLQYRLYVASRNVVLEHGVIYIQVPVPGLVVGNLYTSMCVLHLNPFKLDL